MIAFSFNFRSFLLELQIFKIEIYLEEPSVSLLCTFLVIYYTCMIVLLFIVTKRYNIINIKL